MDEPDVVFDVGNNVVVNVGFNVVVNVGFNVVVNVGFSDVVSLLMSYQCRLNQCLQIFDVITQVLYSGAIVRVQ